MSPLDDVIMGTCWYDGIRSCNSSNEFINTLRPRQNGRYFADDILKCIFLNEDVWIPNTISLKFVPKGPINNIPAMAWRLDGAKPLSEPMISLTMHICVTRPQWVKPVYVCYPTGYLIPHKWENCMTIDRNSWGYRRNVHVDDYLSTDELIATMAETVRYASWEVLRDTYLGDIHIFSFSVGFEGKWFIHSCCWKYHVP